MGLLKALLGFLSESSSLVLAIATLVLVIITFFYLRETRLIRKVADKSFRVETSPKVFLESILCTPHLNYAEKKIEVRATLKIKNVGKTEAKNFVAVYTLSSGRMKMEDKIGPIPYLFPSQGVVYQTKMLDVALNDQQLAVAKEAMDTKKALIVPENFAPPIFLGLSLRYLDHEGKEQNLPYKCKYIFHTNSWVFIIE